MARPAPAVGTAVVLDVETTGFNPPRQRRPWRPCWRCSPVGPAPQAVLYEVLLHAGLLKTRRRPRPSDGERTLENSRQAEEAA